ncbi:hypothetical protein F2Q68_00044027 [Brassica cretica]|uniref:Uncharacterized protein n=2 Tax=Brassica cretica TaxID=69181 RepID=A0ABQ7AUQ7_BRACR|nr:hypothetical protein F2Q68_00044027 [Brassica cretica]KAF3517796.1 hypothetical protein DY000_02060060 [Brassica cretica]
MTSRRKASNKSRRDRSASDGSSSQHDNVVPKVEFAEHSIDPEEVNGYWATMGHVELPIPGMWYPAPFRVNPVDDCPSRSCPNGLDAIQSFCGVPESVEFRLPVAGEVAESPPDGYFTCFEALMQCHLWFPLSEAIVLFSCFGLAIGQVSLRSLKHVVGIMVLSYKHGLPLDVDHLEAMLMPVGSSATVQLSPRNNMAIIAGRAAFLSLGPDGVGNIFLIGYTLVLVSTIFGELVGASGPTRPFGKLDDECFAVQDPLSEALSNLSRGLIV